MYKQSAISKALAVIGTLLILAGIIVGGFLLFDGKILFGILTAIGSVCYGASLIGLGSMLESIEITTYNVSLIAQKAENKE